MAARKIAVIKIGSNVLTKTGYGIEGKILSRLVASVVEIARMGIRPVVVTSGAIATGLQLLGLRHRPRDLPTLQAAASVGQSKLVESYALRFRRYGFNVGQVLLTRNDFLNRETYLNAKKTLERLLELDVIPIINENDAVAVEEIKFGDNDTLAALVAAALKASQLFLLTNVDGFYKNPDDVSTLIKEVEEITPELYQFVSNEKSTYGSGGMPAKLRAAEIATCAGVETVILNGYQPERMVAFYDGVDFVGTRFKPRRMVSSKKHWIAFVLEPQGKIVIDEGARKAITEKNKSLLPAGIVAVEKDFEPGDAVAVVDLKGEIIAKGIVEFSSHEIEQIKGRSSVEVKKILGEDAPEEVIHRDKMVIMVNILKGGKKHGC
jgi:glutamate 5-kinase